MLLACVSATGVAAPTSAVSAAADAVAALALATVPSLSQRNQAGRRGVKCNQAAQHLRLVVELTAAEITTTAAAKSRAQLESRAAGKPRAHL